MIEFQSFEKIPRLNRDIVITEKIDGTNGQIMIADDLGPFTLESGRVVPCMVGSRNRWIFPENDNAGFATWVYANADKLIPILGPGRHFGEWWGAGIQRRYGLAEKRFSLFNVAKWIWLEDPEVRVGRDVPSQLHVVPVIYRGPWNVLDGTFAPTWAKNELRVKGSFAAPGYKNPEGIVVFHTAGSLLFKATLENDEYHKGEARGQDS